MEKGDLSELEWSGGPIHTAEIDRWGPILRLLERTVEYDITFGLTADLVGVVRSIHTVRENIRTTPRPDVGKTMFPPHCLRGNSACRAHILYSQISGDLLSRADNLKLRASKGAYKPAWLTNLVLR
jgi:hypothetical protein